MGTVGEGCEPSNRDHSDISQKQSKTTDYSDTTPEETREIEVSFVMTP